MTRIPPPELGLLATDAELGARAQVLFAYWREKCGGRPLPRRLDLSITDLAIFLPNLVFVDRLTDPLDFRFRLVGSDVVRRSLTDRTGQCASNVPAMAEGSPFWQRYDWVARHATPLFAEVDYVGEDESVRVCQDLILPVADDLEGGVSLMVYVTYVRMGQGEPA